MVLGNGSGHGHPNGTKEGIDTLINAGKINIRRIRSLLLMSAIVLSLYVSGHAQCSDPIDYYIFENIYDKVNPEYWELSKDSCIEIDNIISGKRIIFKAPKSFESAHFYDTAIFRQSHFESMTTFKNSIFRASSPADFASAEFFSDADFRNMICSATANFSGIRCSSITDFSKSSFEQSANFRQSDFHATTRFFAVTFGQNVDFFSSHIHKSHIIFDSCTFNGLVDFRQIEFDSSNADFRWAVFADTALFTDAVLPETLDFRDVRTVFPINLTHASLPSSGNKCKIALVGSEIDKLWINMELFELWFPIDTIFYGTEIVGIDSANSDERDAVYRGLLMQFTDRGYEASREILEKEYYEVIEQRKGLLEQYGLDVFRNLIESKSKKVLSITFVLWLLFSVANIFFLKKKQLNEDVYSVSLLGKKRYIPQRLKRWRIRTLESFVYTAVVFFGLKLSISKFSKGVVKKHPLLFSYLVFIYVSGLVCIGFIANIIFTQ